MIYGVIKDETVVNAIEIDENDFTPEQAQQAFGDAQTIIIPLPETYGIGDLYDNETNVFTKAQVSEEPQIPENPAI